MSQLIRGLIDEKNARLNKSIINTKPIEGFLDLDDSKHVKLIHTANVILVEEKMESFNWHKGPNGPECDQRSIGWFVQFAGSRESLFCGMQKPDINVGDKFRIIFERMP